MSKLLKGQNIITKVWPNTNNWNWMVAGVAPLQPCTCCDHS